jgi:hypothetical protein
MLALASVHPEQYASILLECQGLGLPEVLCAEQRAFGIDPGRGHGRRSSPDWGLPERLLRRDPPARAARAAGRRDQSSRRS